MALATTIPGSRFKNTKTKVSVVCGRHGAFEVTPDDNRSRGCPSCGRERQADSYRKDTSRFIAEAHAIHGVSYDYSRVNYRQAREKVEIVCGMHGSFSGRHLTTTCKVMDAQNAGIANSERLGREPQSSSGKRKKNSEIASTIQKSSMSMHGLR